MVRVLITGMSGTGKSSVIAALDTLGYRAVDADEGRYSHLVHIPDDEPTGLDPGTDWAWDESQITELLDEPDDTPLFVGGCAPNQGRFRARFDHVILLSAPPELMASRLRSRATNPYGQREEDVARSLQMKTLIEPYLRASADVEIDTRAPIAEVLEMILRHVGIGDT